MKSGFVPVAAGIVMFVFGLAIVAALGRGIVGGIRRRSWPVVDGRVTLTTSKEGRENALALIRYTAPDGSHHTLETPTGGMNTNGRDGQIMPLAVDPQNPNRAVPKTSAGSMAMLGCFALIALVFAVFGAVAALTVLL